MIQIDTRDIDRYTEILIVNGYNDNDKCFS